MGPQPNFYHKALIQITNTCPYVSGTNAEKTGGVREIRVITDCL